MPNRLAKETSPYLLQHKDNPVDWYPWGDAAFAKAHVEDKPILLSVGYSSCHWCHVMAHESFENPEIAKLMNDWFVNIKVDREERPDIDGVYMTALQATTGSGGWPMTVFMTAEGKPFFAGTYFGPEDGNGRPGFPRILEALHTAWVEEREVVTGQADAIASHLREMMHRVQPPAAPGTISADLPKQGMDLLRKTFDDTWGGFGGAPKFPPHATLEFLLAYVARTGDSDETHPPALGMALLTLQRMYQGGIYDHVGGGFCRYSVDEHWLVPHFEKMLYDNAQLARVYLHAFQVTEQPFYAAVAEETLNCIGRDLLSAEGGFSSAQDADSGGIEGQYYVWTRDEIYEALGDGAELFCTWHNVTEEGNFTDPHHPELTGRNVLTAWLDPLQVGEQFGLGVEELEDRLEELRDVLFQVRERRTKPGLDDKVLTSWNGLALAAFAEAARIFGDERYREVAETNAAFVKEHLWRDGRLLHTYRAGEAKVDGMLEDYAYYGLGLVELYKATGDLSYLNWAKELFETILARFHDDAHGGFFETASDAEELIFRQKVAHDGATPSGNAATGLLALWLGRYYGRPEWEKVGEEVVGLVSGFLLEAAGGLGTTWQCIEFLLAPHRELAIVGTPSGRDPFEREVANRYLPWLAIAPADAGQGLPLLEGRDAGYGALAYYCENMTCQLPAATAEDLAAQLDG